MAKAYWIATYFSISNPDALAEYAKLAGPAISANGGALMPMSDSGGGALRLMATFPSGTEALAAALQIRREADAGSTPTNRKDGDLRIVEGLA